MNYRLKKISGDASFREFYRLKKGNKTSIIVQAKKNKFKNLIIYVIIIDEHDYTYLHFVDHIPVIFVF